jgi:hypothetical protein
LDLLALETSWVKERRIFLGDIFARESVFERKAFLPET